MNYLAHKIAIKVIKTNTAILVRPEVIPTIPTILTTMAHQAEDLPEEIRQEEDPRGGLLAIKTLGDLGRLEDLTARLEARQEDPQEEDPLEAHRPATIDHQIAFP